MNHLHKGEMSELREALDFREDLAVLGEDAGVGCIRTRWQLGREFPTRYNMAGWRRFLSSLRWRVWSCGRYRGIAAPPVAVLVVEGAVRYWLRKPIEQVLHDAEHAFHDLELLAGVLARTETQVFGPPRLQALQRELRSKLEPASAAIARLRTIVDLSNSRSNMFVAVLDVPLMYSVQVALAAERWRQARGSTVRNLLAGSWRN